MKFIARKIMNDPVYGIIKTNNIFKIIAAIPEVIKEMKKT